MLRSTAGLEAVPTGIDERAERRLATLVGSNKGGRRVFVLAKAARKLMETAPSVLEWPLSSSGAKLSLPPNQRLDLCPSQIASLSCDSFPKPQPCRTDQLGVSRNTQRSTEFLRHAY
jgi:hypothetical protein